MFVASGSSIRARAIVAGAPLFALTIVAAGCSSDEPQAKAPSTTSVSSTATGDVGGWAPDELVWADCEAKPSFDCATLQVPRDWSDPRGDTIGLALTRTQATGERIGSLFLNPGGPGGSGIQFLQDSSFNARLTERFDLVSWDPRGVGASAGLTCGEDGLVEQFLANDPGPDTAEESAALFDDARAIADDCAAPATSDGDLIGHMGTDDVARDLEALRLAVGDEQLSYLGFSYGTQIGLDYLKQFPTSVRAMVLDGVVDPTQTLTEWLSAQAAAFEASLDRIFEDCGSDCPVKSLGDAFEELTEQVETAPIDGTDGASLGPAELQTAAVYSSYDQRNWSRFADGVADALDGDPTGLLALARSYYDFGGFTSYVAVSCLDSPHPRGAEEYGAFIDELSSAAPRIGAMIAAELAPCAYWAHEGREPLGLVEAPGAAPVLVVGTTGDAATPYANAQRVAAELSSGVLVTQVGEGHTAYGRSSCVTDTVDSYLIDLVVPDSDPRCDE